MGDRGDGREAIDLAEALRPDIAIPDLSMPEFDGLEVTARLVGTIPGIRILLLTGHAAEPVLKQVRRAGAHGFVAKNDVSGKLVEAVERIVAGCHPLRRFRLRALSAFRASTSGCR